MDIQKETIHVAWPTSGQVDNYFAISLMDLVRAFPNVKSYNSIQGTGVISKSRNLIVQQFLASGEDWLLMIDSDQFIAIPSIEKLINAADKDTTPYISGLVFASHSTLELIPSPCIFKLDENSIMRPYHNYVDDSVIEVDAAGGGCVLVHRSVLQKIQEVFADEQIGDSWVWFQDGPISPKAWLSEDIFFSQRVRDAGFTLHAHTGAVIPHLKPLWITDVHYKQWQKLNNPN